ncbi:MAG: hypothetical protein IPI35_35370 [Deltaproteobacteria bacterium]|nr:hypothetical protein [Deltaproteobacteria bacterium]
MSAWGDDGARVSDGSPAALTVLDSGRARTLVSRRAERLLDPNGEATFTVTSAGGLTELNAVRGAERADVDGVMDRRTLSEDVTCGRVMG